MPQVPVEQREAMTFEEIGRSLGITGQYARMLCRRALAKLQHNREMKELLQIAASRDFSGVNLDLKGHY